MPRTRKLIPIALAALIASVATAADQPQWGQTFSRNMVSNEKGLPDSFDISTGKYIKWVAQLGSQSYSTPIVADGCVLIGTNNDAPRDPKHRGDRAVLMCLDEKDGHLIWQLVIPKMEDDPYLDWPKAGFASAPTVEQGRVYTLTNRGELVCLDLKGMANGNDGPYRDEGRHMTPRGDSTMTPGPTDADIIWITDLVKEAGVHIHDQVHGSILIDGDLLYVNSANGVDNTHRVIRCPDAPSLIVLDKKTGRIVGRDDQRIAPNIFHCQWCSPSMGIVNGRKLVFLGGDDGICYAFDALKAMLPAGQAARLALVWKFDCDPTAPKLDIHKWVTNRHDGPSVIMGMPVFVDNRIYVMSGGDLWWGKHEGRIQCVDATKTGDITSTGQIWSYRLSRETCCTPAVYDGLVFVADCGGMIHCLDAQTGRPYWTHKASGDIWASPMIADGKLYIGTRRGQFLVMAAGKTKQLISETNLGDAISATATPANGTIYVATLTHLYAIGQGAGSVR